MRKQIFGRQLQRDANERKALLKGLVSAIVVEESIKTTQAKAKAVKGLVEKLVTKAKLGGENNKKGLLRYLTPALAQKMITEIAPRFAQRPGGYTRIINLGKRLRDDASMVVFEWVVKKEPVKTEAISKDKVKEEKLELEAAVKEPKEKKVTKKITKQPKEKTAKKK